MIRMASIICLLWVATGALAAPPNQLRSALESWAAPEPIPRFEFALLDLNDDQTLDAVVRVTDSSHCGNGGCLLLTFKGTPAGFERIGDSGYVAKPIYLLKEVNFGWISLAGMVGMGQGASVRPIRYMGAGYRADPIMRAHIDTQPSHKSPGIEAVIQFERVD